MRSLRPPISAFSFQRFSFSPLARAASPPPAANALPWDPSTVRSGTRSILPFLADCRHPVQNIPRPHECSTPLRISPASSAPVHDESCVPRGLSVLLRKRVAARPSRTLSRACLYRSADLARHATRPKIAIAQTHRRVQTSNAGEANTLAPKARQSSLPSGASPTTATTLRWTFLGGSLLPQACSPGEK